MLSQQIKRQSVRCYCNLVAALYQRFNDGYILLVACPRPQLSTQYNIFCRWESNRYAVYLPVICSRSCLAFKSIQIGYDAQVVGGSCQMVIAKAIVDAYLSDLMPKPRLKPAILLKVERLSSCLLWWL